MELVVQLLVFLSCLVGAVFITFKVVEALIVAAHAAASASNVELRGNYRVIECGKSFGRYKTLVRLEDGSIRELYPDIESLRKILDNQMPGPVLH